jgi:hypothetical protein
MATMVTPIKIGDIQPAIETAEPPANPNRARKPAVVHVGTAAAAPNNAPNTVLVFPPPTAALLRFRSLIDK